MSNYVVSAGVADIRREPDPASELVTQALMNVSVHTGETSGGWSYVKLSDYEGWIRSDELEEPIPRSFCKIGESCTSALPLVAVIVATHTQLYAELEGEESIGEAYLSTALPLLDTYHEQRVQVGLPGERSAWIAREGMVVRQPEAPYLQISISTITGFARLFLGRPYLWGGTSWQGLDCSGFVQLCYRMGGFILPRDADQQFAFLGQEVERTAMQEGDLIFFGNTSITHVALALNDHEYIHAEGQNYQRVLINSFQPADAHYYPRLVQLVWGIKRVIS